MVNCNTHDEYFESNYEFSQGLLDPGDEEDYIQVVQTVLFSKCQKDPFSMVVSKFCYIGLLLNLKYNFHNVLSYKCFLNYKN